MLQSVSVAWQKGFHSRQKLKWFPLSVKVPLSKVPLSPKCSLVRSLREDVRNHARREHVEKYHLKRNVQKGQPAQRGPRREILHTVRSVAVISPLEYLEAR